MLFLAVRNVRDFYDVQGWYNGSRSLSVGCLSHSTHQGSLTTSNRRSGIMVPRFFYSILFIWILIV